MPTINVSPASATVTTTVSKTVASNVCGDIPPTIPVNIDCSLCAIGFPQAGGQISISFYGPICPPATEPSPSYWLGSSAKMAPWKCPNPGMNAEPNANKWVATGFFSGISGGSCANQYKFEAELNAISTTQIIVSVKVYVLTPTTGGATWSLYVQFSEVMTEIPSMDSTSYRSRAFASTNYMPISVNQIGGKGDPVSYYKMTVGLESMRVGCADPSTGSNAVPDVCGMWDGSQWLSCLRGFIKSTANTAIREFTQLGFNASGCGSVGGIQCDCDSITLTGTSPVTGTTTYNDDPVFVTDYGILGIAGGVEAVGVKQEIQVAKGTAAGIQVVVKSINQVIYICTNNNGAGWICSTATVAQANSPRILTATRATFVVYLYALNFPNPEILPIECYTPPVGGIEPFQMNYSEPPEPINEPVLDQTQIKFLNRMRLPCIHLGQSIQGSNRSGCGSCHKHICRLHGECRKIDPSNEVRQCVTCEDYFNG
jgi:hypothetical protein